MKSSWFNLFLILIIIILGGLYGRALFLLDQRGASAPLPEPVIIETVIYKYYDDAKTQYVYTPFPESWEIADNLTLAEFPLSLEQTIKSSLDGAGFHLYWYKQGVDTNHNLYWWNVHKSAAYWMEGLR